MLAALEGENIDQLEQGTTWDESIWSADRDGNTLHPLGASAAPTRGPSPAPSLGMTNPKTKNDEDSDLQAAINASMQESGVITQDGNDVKFGPATRDQYDTDQWALVTSQSTAQEVVPDLPAKKRLQQGQEPRLLKHLPDGDYTPNMLTIFHAIPKAKEALLMRGCVNSDYGSDPEWWRGNSIPVPRIVHTIDGSPVAPDTDKHDELIAEAQRLMAFLECSDRTYATIGGITNADIIRNNNLQTTRSGSLLELFLQSWVVAAVSKISSSPEQSKQVSGLFTTVVGTTAKEGMDSPDMTVIDMSLEAGDKDKVDLFELLDNLLWDTDPDDSDRPENYVERPADILVMKATRAQTPDASAPLGLEAPASFYIDRYLQENVAATKIIRQQMAFNRKRINKIDEIERKLRTWQHPNKSSRIDARKLLDHTLGHFSGKNRKNIDDEDRTNSASLATVEPPHYPEVVQQLEQVIASIDRKLEVLAEEKEKTRKAVSDMSRAPPSEEFEQKHRYTLRGVATKPNITYLLQAKSPSESTDMVLQLDDDTTPEGFQWWRLEYEVAGSTAKMLRTPAGDYDVLRAIELEHNSALLVYANEDAADLDYLLGDLPEPLKDFIVRDNQEFATELSRAEADPPAYGDDIFTNDDDLNEIPRRSIEPRASMDSLKVVNGGDTPPMADSPPAYGDGDASQHHAYGLGYGSKPDPPVAEIHLDDDLNLLDESGAGSKEVEEMVEKQHAPLVPRSGMSSGPTDDIDMGGTDSQEMGVGGATHVEDAEMKWCDSLV